MGKHRSYCPPALAGILQEAGQTAQCQCKGMHQLYQCNTGIMQEACHTAQCQSDSPQERLDRTNEMLA